MRPCHSIARQVKLIWQLPNHIRFVAAGGLCALLQVLLLIALVRAARMPPLVANLVAAAVSTQVNFGLSVAFTWRERIPASGPKYLIRRLMSYNGLAVGTLAVNELVFSISLRFVSYPVAGWLGILVAASLNYMVSRKVIFARYLPWLRPNPW